MGCGGSSEETQGQEVPEEDFDLHREVQFANEGQQYQKTEKKAENDDALFQSAAEESPEQFMATKPWLGALVAPTNAPAIDNSPPAISLKLEYVNGYRCEDSRQNVYFSAVADTIVFMSAAVGVVQQLSKNTQQFFGAGRVGEVKDGHNDDIEALHVDPERKLCATGQRGKNPLIYVWDIATQQVVFKAQQGTNTRAVRLLRFSADGQFIFTVDLQESNQLHVFSLQSRTKVTSTKVGPGPVFDLDTSSGQYAGAIAMKDGVKFFTFDGSTLKVQQGLSGAANKIEDHTAVAFFSDGNGTVSGTPGGNLHLWEGNKSVRVIAGAHQGAINAIAIRDGLALSSGYTDKKLQVWAVAAGGDWQRGDCFNLPSCARSLDINPANKAQFVAGTRDGQIIVIQGGTQKIVLNGHGSGETWGLAVAPDKDPSNTVVVTTGDDNKIIVFDASTNKVISQSLVNAVPGKKQKILGASTLSLYPPNQQSRAVAVNATNGHVAVATNVGEVQIRQGVRDLDTVVMQRGVAREWIEVLKYSPNGQFLAVGSHDNKIYILAVAQNYQTVATLAKHNSFITSLDWSTDSLHIQSNCGAYELLFYDATNGNQLPSGATQLRDEKWATFSNKIGWPVQGIFPPCTNGTHVYGVDRSKGGDVFATADDWGLVNLFRNPNAKGSASISYRAHSSHVVRVAFDSGDEYLYSVGGYDRTLMKWKVTRK